MSFEEIILIPFATCFIFALCSALGSLFLDNAMNEGHIFEGYYNFIERITSKYDAKGKKIGHYNIFKPLGGCGACMSTWVAIFTFVILCTNSNIQWWWLFPYIFISSFLFLLSKKLIHESDEVQ